MVYLFITRVRVNHSYSMDNQFLVSPDSFLASLGSSSLRSIATPLGQGGITTPQLPRPASQPFAAPHSQTLTDPAGEAYLSQTSTAIG